MINICQNEFRTLKVGQRLFFVSPYMDCSLKSANGLISLVGMVGGRLSGGVYVCVSSVLSEHPNNDWSALTQPNPISTVPPPSTTGRLLLVEISRDGAFRGHNVNCRTPVVLNRGTAPGSITVSWKVEEP